MAGPYDHLIVTFDGVGGGYDQTYTVPKLGPTGYIFKLDMGAPANGIYVEISSSSQEIITFTGSIPGILWYDKGAVDFDLGVEIPNLVPGGSGSGRIQGKIEADPPLDPPIPSYKLISKADGGNLNVPDYFPPGIQGIDWEWTGENNMITVRRLVAAAENTIWYEEID